MRWQLFRLAEPPEGYFLAFLPDVPSWFVFDDVTFGILRRRPDFSWVTPEGPIPCSSGQAVPFDVPDDGPHQGFSAGMEDIVKKRYAYILDDVKAKLKKTPQQGLSLYSINVAVTTRCPLACRFCTVEPRRSNIPDPPLAVVADWLRLFAQAGAQHVFFTGGEPFMRHDIFDIFTMCIEEGIGFEVSTNGIFMDRQGAGRLQALQAAVFGRQGFPDFCHLCGTVIGRFEPFCPSCDSPLTPFTVRVSVEASDPDLNDYLRGPGAYTSAMKTLDLLSSHGLAVIPSITLMRQNRENVPLLIRRLCDNGFRWIRVLPVAPQGKALSAWRDLILTGDEMVEFYAQLIAMLDPAEKPPHIDFFHRKRSFLMNCMVHEGCRGCRQLYVDASGEAYPCDQLICEPFSLGRVEDGPERLFAKKGTVCGAISVPAADIQSCKSCLFARICNAGCPGRRYAAFGDAKCADPNCETYQRLYFRMIAETVQNYRSPRNLACTVLASA